MPPVVAGVLAVVSVIQTSTVAETIPPNVLLITGVLFQFGKPSTHLLIADAEGGERDLGSITFQSVSPEYLEALCGIPICSPDKKTEIGRVLRAWVENDHVRIEGWIRDSLQGRSSLATNRCGLCIVNTLDICDGKVREAKPTHVNITVPGQSGFRESWVRLMCEPAPLPESNKPQACALHPASGW